MYSKIKVSSPLKIGIILVMVAVIASAVAALSVFDSEADGISAELPESGLCGTNATYSYYSDGTLVIAGSGNMYDYQFAGTPWFGHTDSIRKIVIGDGITSLSNWAFIKCTNLKELTMPITLNSVRSDTHAAFEGCCNIEKITFSLGKDGYCCDYTAYKGTSDAWYGKTPWYQSRDTLKEIVIPDGTTHIGSDAFRELNITSVIVPESVTSVGSHCFYNCKKLTDLTISLSVNPYGNEDYPAFQGCTSLSNITVTRGTGSPYSYDSWTGGFECLKYAPWNLCPDVPKRLTIAENVTSLGKVLFENCYIVELTIPISLNAVWLDSYANFKNVTTIEKVTFTPGSGYGFNYAASRDSNCWFESTPWYYSKAVLKEVVFEEGITHIGNEALRNLNITSLVIPDTVESLGSHTFYQCSKLKELTIPISLDSVASANSPAFEGCSLETVNFSPGAYGIGYDYSEGYYPPWANVDGTSITRLTFDGYVLYIGHETFHGYTFHGKYGEMKPYGYNLWGRSFEGADGDMWLCGSEVTDQEKPSGGDVPEPDLEISGSSDLSSAVRTVFQYVDSLFLRFMAFLETLMGSLS